MAKDSEERFVSVMNKLFQAPKSTPESSPASRGQKRAHISSASGSKDPSPKLEVVKKLKHLPSLAGSSDVPMCRPWDRDDLMKRLGTFKSMSWFAKPKAVSAVNCARRGWINVDMDMIACESCRAQLLFSTPPSWNQQQVEKAALVFSLKLENGHKLLCPWIDNACDEELADFPPTTAPDLIDKFRQRCLKLLPVLSLPVVSSAAIEYMRNHQVEEFLENCVLLEFGDGSSDDSETEYLRKEHNTKSSKLYYQALKLISLCGWEPRSLPYVVDFKDGSNHSVKAVNTLEYGKNPNALSTCIDDSTMGDVKTSCGPQPDLGSVVLDCKLCGASVALWTFPAVLKPLEIFRLVGPTNEGTDDDRGDHDSCNQDHVEKTKDASFLVNSSNRSTSLDTTIAGGPPPTRQNFKATISLPVASRTLGDWLMLGLNPEYMDISDETLLSGLMSTPTEAIQEGCRMYDYEEMLNDQQLLEYIHPRGSPQSDGLELSIQNDENILQGSPQNVKLLNSAEKGLENFTELEPGSSQILEKDDQISEGRSSLSSRSAPCAEISLKANTNGDIESQYSDCGPRDETLLPKQGSIQEGCAMNEKMQISTEPVARHRAASDKVVQFDPIKQHRYFCPWIASTNNGASGWQQTISAIVRKKEFPSSSPNDFLSSSIIKVNDPVTSVRKLFTASAKKLKQSLSSNKTT